MHGSLSLHHATPILFLADLFFAENIITLAILFVIKWDLSSKGSNSNWVLIMSKHLLQLSVCPHYEFFYHSQLRKVLPFTNVMWNVMWKMHTLILACKTTSPFTLNSSKYAFFHELPPELQNKPNIVCKWLVSVCRLKQRAHDWYTEVKRFFTECGYAVLATDEAIF